MLREPCVKRDVAKCAAFLQSSWMRYPSVVWTDTLALVACHPCSRRNELLCSLDEISTDCPRKSSDEIRRIVDSVPPVKIRAEFVGTVGPQGSSWHPLFTTRQGTTWSCTTDLLTNNKIKNHCQQPHIKLMIKGAVDRNWTHNLLHHERSRYQLDHWSLRHYCPI
jgi:hypothetical protein